MSGLYVLGFLAAAVVCLVVVPWLHARERRLEDERFEAFLASYPRGFFGPAPYPSTCPVCRGTGGGVWNDCAACGGNGVV